MGIAMSNLNLCFPNVLLKDVISCICIGDP